MKRLTAITTALLLMSATMPVEAQRRRAAAAVDNSISIAFVDASSEGTRMTASGSDGWIDVETLIHVGASKERFTRTRRRFGIRIVRAGETSWGTAVITARLDSTDGRATMRLDGRTLTTVPMIVEAHAAVGSVTYHTLEIDVPISAPEGPLAASIAWDATTE